MRAFRLSVGLALALGCLTLDAARQAPATARYFPAAGKWETRTPAQMGLDPAALDAAIRLLETGTETSRAVVACQP